MIDPTELLSTEEVATLFRVTPETIGKWRGEGRGPSYFRIGRRCYYSREAISRFFAAQEHSPKTPST